MTLDAAGRLLEANAERHLKAAAGNGAAVSPLPGSGRARPCVFSSSCSFSLEELRGTEYPEETRKAMPRRRRRWSPSPRRAQASAFRDGMPAKVAARARRGIAADRRAELRAVLPHRARHREICPQPARTDSLPGPRLGGEFDHLLLPRHHRGRSPRASIFCSSASSPRSGASRPTSTSISSMSGARRSSSTSTRNTAASAPAWPRP